LDEAMPALAKGNPHDPVLMSAVERAAAQLPAGMVNPELQRRVEQLLLDQHMLTQLDEAHLQRSAVGQETGLDLAGAERLYARALGDSGWEVGAVDSKGAAQGGRASAIADRLCAALDDWAGLRGQLIRGGGVPLRAITDLADDDPWRRRLRQAA